jgi:hypothetical protein
MINSKVQAIYPLAIVRDSNLYEHIAKMIERYWENSVPKALFRKPHFEDVLYAIFALAAAYPAGAHTSALGALIQAQWFPDVLEFGKPKRVGRNVLHHLANIAVDAIAEGFRERCIATEKSNVVEFARLSRFVAALRSEFDVAVVTLNYDNVMYRGFRGIETGFDTGTGEFQEERILGRSEWPCMLHLHGSVHFDMPTSAGCDLHEIFWEPNINAKFAQNAGGRSSRAYPEGADFPTSVVVAGYGKTTQILRRPFRTYYSELDRLVSNCEALLFAGYGFGDPHLNIAFERFRDARRRPIVILGFANKGTPNLQGADQDSQIAISIVHTLRTDLRSMSSLGYKIPDVVDDLLDAEEFEVSSNSDTPLSMWYNGMLAACDNASKVIAKLK